MPDFNDLDINFRAQLKPAFAQLDKVYGEKKAKYLKDEIVKKLVAGSALSVDQKNSLANLVEKIAADHEKSYKKYVNVLNQKGALRDAREKVGRFDSGALSAKMIERMGVSPITSWLPMREKYGMEYPTGSDYRDKIEVIKNYEGKVIHNGLPDEEYSYLLKAAEDEISCDINLHTMRLVSALEKNSDLSNAQKERFAREIGKKEFYAKKAGLKLGNYLHNTFDKVGRGIWSKSDPAQNRNYQEFIRKRNDVISNLVWQFAPSSSSKTQVMNNIKRLLENAKLDDSALIDSNTFSQIMDLIKKEVEADGKQVDDMVKQLNDINDKVLASAKDQSKAEDDMWKYRVLQIALIITPFCGVSLIAPFASAIGHVLGPGGIAQGVSHLVTSDFLGPFGKFAELIRLDVAINWILGDCPVIGSITGLVDSITTSGVAQSAFNGVLFPILSSPVLPFYVAGIYSLSRVANTEIPHYKKYNKVFENHRKALDAKVSELLSKKKTEDSDFSNFAKTKYNLYKKCYEIEAISNLVNFLESFENDVSRKNHNNLLNIFGGDFYKMLQENKLIDDRHKIDTTKLASILSDMKEKKPDDYKKFFEKYLLFRSVERDSDIGDSINDKINKFIEIERVSHPSHKAKLIDEESKFLSQDFAFDMAKLYDIDFDEAVKKENSAKRKSVADELEKKIIGKEMDFLSDIVKNKKDPIEGVDKFVKRAKAPSNEIKPVGAGVVNPAKGAALPVAI